MTAAHLLAALAPALCLLALALALPIVAILGRDLLTTDYPDPED